MIMFSSDVSARGMDYPDVSCIVQVGLPMSVEQYIHRLGRTARGVGVSGHAILLLSDFERPFLSDLKTFGVKEVSAPPLTAEVESILANGMHVNATQPASEADRATQVTLTLPCLFVYVLSHPGIACAASRRTHLSVCSGVSFNETFFL